MQTKQEKEEKEDPPPLNQSNRILHLVRQQSGQTNSFCFIPAVPKARGLRISRSINPESRIDGDKIILSSTDSKGGGVI